MTSPKFLRDKINNFVKSLKVSDKLLVSKNSTVDRLINIINIENFDNKTNKEIDFFCKKFEISNKLFVSYDASGNKSTDKILGPEGLQIFVCLLYLRLLIYIDQDSSEINTVKYIVKFYIYIFRNIIFNIISSVRTFSINPLSLSMTH